MYDILSTSVVTCPYVCQSCNGIPSACEAATDPWLFTNPAARVAYTFQERVHLLKEDIRTYMMHNDRWSAEELNYHDQVQLLLRENVLITKGTFGYLSPHPTVYRAVREGTLHIAGHPLYLKTGDDIMFMSWLERLAHPGHVWPVRIGRLYYTTCMQLCSERFPGIHGLCQSDLVVLRRCFT